jgi:hypothetical protein
VSEENRNPARTCTDPGKKERRGTGIRSAPKIVPAEAEGLFFGLGLRETGHAPASFPLTALAQEFNALEPLEHVPFFAAAAGCPKATMLRHNLLKKLSARR